MISRTKKKTLLHVSLNRFTKNYLRLTVNVVSTIRDIWVIVCLIIMIIFTNKVNLYYQEGMLLNIIDKIKYIWKIIYEGGRGSNSDTSIYIKELTCDEENGSYKYE